MREMRALRRQVARAQVARAQVAQRLFPRLLVSRRQVVRIKCVCVCVCVCVCPPLCVFLFPACSCSRHHTAIQPHAHFADSCRHAAGHRWLLGSEPN